MLLKNGLFFGRLGKAAAPFCGSRLSALVIHTYIEARPVPSFV
jgi:hypothetical protein